MDPLLPRVLVLTVLFFPSVLSLPAPPVRVAQSPENPRYMREQALLEQSDAFKYGNFRD